ncbi:MAG TPA: hypothetical protein VIQ29_04385 [Ancylobacter sp.]
MNLFEAFVYGIGWQWWAWLSLPAVAIAIVALIRVVGMSRALQIGAAIGTALAGLVALRSARQQGWDDRETKLTRDTAQAVRDQQDIRNETARLSDDALDRDNGRWVRKP